MMEEEDHADFILGHFLERFEIAAAMGRGEVICGKSHWVADVIPCSDCKAAV